MNRNQIFTGLLWGFMGLLLGYFVGAFAEYEALAPIFGLLGIIFGIWHARRVASVQTHSVRHLAIYTFLYGFFGIILGTIIAFFVILKFSCKDPSGGSLVATCGSAAFVLSLLFGGIPGLIFGLIFGMARGRRFDQSP